MDGNSIDRSKWSRLEFYKGLHAWLQRNEAKYRHRIMNAPDESRTAADAHAKMEAVAALVKELEKTTGFENRFPWEVPPNPGGIQTWTD